MKQALKEAQMNVKDTRKFMEIIFWRKSLQSKGGGTRDERSCQIHQEQIQEQRNLGHGRSEAELEWEPLIPQDRDWETRNRL